MEQHSEEQAFIDWEPHLGKIHWQSLANLGQNSMPLQFTNGALIMSEYNIIDLLQ